VGARVKFQRVQSPKYTKIYEQFFKFRGFMNPPHYYVAPPLTPTLDMERDLITPTYKKKRPQLLIYYHVKVVKFSRFHFCLKK
jgi:hypothetical protein